MAYELYRIMKVVMNREEPQFTSDSTDLSCV